MCVRSEVLEQLRQVAQEQHKQIGPLSDESPLLDLGLDSLCYAILVTRLESVLGVDPFSTTEDGTFPVTVGEFIRLYESAAQKLS